jgi:hypothetical protein
MLPSTTLALDGLGWFAMRTTTCVSVDLFPNFFFLLRRHGARFDACRPGPSAIHDVSRFVVQLKSGSSIPMYLILCHLQLSIWQGHDAENPATHGKVPVLTCDVWGS